MAEQQSIPNLSMVLIEEAFLLLVQKSLPVYLHNISRSRPPVAQGEYLPAATAITLLVTGLDYHLCRLKYLRDIAKHDSPLPNTPYFNWTFTDALSTKVRRVLVYGKDTRLLTQLIEMTVCRDAIIHPKFHTVTLRYSDLGDHLVEAELPPGISHLPKTIKHKMPQREFSTLLKLPLVPTWIN